jgi:NitT/TauT family transport system substrate-binding protein
MRRAFLKTLLAAPVALALPSIVLAQTGKPEKSELTIAVGGKNLFYYLPLTIAERLGYFKDEGLAVQIPDFPGGSKALQALMGGSADMVSGAYEHTILMQAKGQFIESFVLQGRAPQIVLAASNKTLPDYKSLADLKGKKIGVTAPGSSTAIMASFVLAKAGIKPTDVSFIGVGGGAGALTAMRTGQIDAIANLDPVISTLEREHLIRVVVDTRTLKDTQSVYGGPMPAGCLYTGDKFIQQNPNTVQAVTNAMVRALRWLQRAAPSDLVKAVPQEYLMGDQSLYLDAWAHVKEAISPDGLMPADGPATALKVMQSFEPEVKGRAIDLTRTWSNAFAQQAAAKYS